MQTHPKPTRAAALEALEDFVPRAGRHYAAHRNSDHGQDDRSNVSSLSPYIRHRLITEQQVVDAVLRHHSLVDAEKFVQEVFWRTYWKGWLEMRPAVWDDYERGVDMLLAPRTDDSWNDHYAKACEACTRYDFFNDWVNELKETGYLHNHTRMWFASIWIFVLEIPWELGADFFYRHLLDGDAASNTLSWRWVAGLQTVGKAYFATAENIARFTGGRIAPDKIPMLSAPNAEDVKIYPAIPLPVVEGRASGHVGLLLTEEDLHPESLGLDRFSIEAVAGVSAVTARSSLPVSKQVADFTNGAVADGLNRAATHWSVAGQSLQRFDSETLIKWAQLHQLSAIVTAYAPVGPVATQLARLRPELATQGVTLHQVRRDWDSHAWPHATKGFFAFKERIPELLTRS